MILKPSVLKFLAVGLLNTAVTYFSYALLVVCGVSWTVASPVSYALGMLNSYMLNKYWTFKDKTAVTILQILRFVVVNLASWGISFVFLWFFIDVVGTDKLLAQIPAMFFSLSVNYLGSKFFVFMNNKSLPLAGGELQERNS